MRTNDDTHPQSRFLRYHPSWPSTSAGTLCRGGHGNLLTVMTDPARPLLDLDRFRRLANDLDQPDAAVNFVAAYRELLPARVNRILSALSNEDPEEALDAILSLKTSSAMTGARQMEHNCLRLQDGLRVGTPMKTLAAATTLTRDIPPLMAALQELLEWLAVPN